MLLKSLEWANSLNLYWEKRFHTPNRPPQEIVETKGLVQVTDEKAIEAVVLEVLARSAKEVEAYISFALNICWYTSLLGRQTPNRNLIPQT